MRVSDDTVGPNRLHRGCVDRLNSAYIADADRPGALANCLETKALVKGVKADHLRPSQVPSIAPTAHPGACFCFTSVGSKTLGLVAKICPLLNKQQ